MLERIISTNIGIFYKDLTWKDEIFKMLSDEAAECLLLYFIDKNTIHLRDVHMDTTITFCPINDSTRGHRFDKVYYQYGIEDEALSRYVRRSFIPKMTFLE